MAVHIASKRHDSSNTELPDSPGEGLYQRLFERALGPVLLGQLQEAIDAAEEKNSAILIAGRPGTFSAGFDVAVIRQGPEKTREMTTQRWKTREIMTPNRQTRNLCWRMGFGFRLK